MASRATYRLISALFVFAALLPAGLARAQAQPTKPQDPPPGANTPRGVDHPPAPAPKVPKEPSTPPHTPPTAEEIAGKLPPPATRQVDFARDIKPLFEASCIQCHAKGKTK